MNPSAIFVGFADGSEASHPRRLFFTPQERATGMHVIGAPGGGKSKFLEHLMRQDIRHGDGVTLIDWHGELYNAMVAYCARHRPRRPVYLLNLSRGEPIVGFNPFIAGSGDVGTQVNNRIMATVKAWGVQSTDETPRLERWLRCVYHAIIESPGKTLLEAEYLVDYASSAERAYLTSFIRNPLIRKQWDDLAAVKSAEKFNEQIDSTKNRLMRFLAARSTARFFALTQCNLHLPTLMDTGGVLLVNLKPSDQLDPMNARLFGTLLVSEFYETARRRQGKRGRPLRPHYLYLDEFQNFLTSDIAELLAQGRKFGLAPVLSHQFLDQIRQEDPKILAALHGACRIKVVFGVGSNTDAMELVHEMFPGQIDYNEIKRLDYSVKFWPVYGRDYVRTAGRSRSHGVSESVATATTRGRSSSAGESRMDGASTGKGSSASTALLTSAGVSNPLPDLDPETGTAFQGTGTSVMNALSALEMTSFAHGTAVGRSESEAESASVAHGETLAESSNESVADVPIYHPEPFLEATPTLYTLDEQRQRCADLLRLQFTRHCFVRTPDGTTRPILVPRVTDVRLSPQRIAAYEAHLAQRVGAAAPDAVDRLIDLRRQELEESAARARLPVPVRDIAAERGRMEDAPDDDAYAVINTAPRPRRTA